jgi:hypothetical protein
MTASEEPKTISDVQLLVERLSDSPEDDRTAQVLADWLESIGFHDGAETLRTGRDLGPGYLPVLASLRTMFGIPNESGGETDRYTAVFGFPRTIIGPAETQTISTQAYVICRIRRLLIPNNINDHITVSDLRFGPNSLFLNNDPLPGQLFGERMPDLFSTRFIQVNERVSLTVENRGYVEIDFTGSVLGDAPEMDAKGRAKAQTNERMIDLERKLDEMQEANARLKETVDMLRSLTSSQSEQLAMLRKRIEE